MNASEQNSGQFEWNKAKQDAAEDLARGELSTEQIAEKAGVCRTTLWNWRQHSEFTARVDQLLQEFSVEARRRGLAVLDRRVAALNDRWTRMRRLMEARADSMPEVPGGSTGLLVRRYKSLGSGESAKIVEEYEFDAALFRELREHEKQAAQELRQWLEKREVSGSVSVSLPNLSGLTSDELDTLRRLASKVDGGPEGSPEGD